jgi:hypothetical protein
MTDRGSAESGIPSPLGNHAGPDSGRQMQGLDPTAPLAVSPSPRVCNQESSPETSPSTRQSRTMRHPSHPPWNQGEMRSLPTWRGTLPRQSWSRQYGSGETR